MTTNLQLVEQPSEPERCAAEDLTRGQFLAAGQLTTGRPTEVRFVDTFPRPGGGRETLIVHRPVGVEYSVASVTDAPHRFTLATEQQLAEFRAGVERTQRIADIRALADWLEDNPDLPMPNYFDANAHLDERHLGGPSIAEAYAKVHEVAGLLAVEAEERLDDRTTVSKTFGRVTYQVIAWHPDGRPAEPAPEPEQGERIDVGAAGCGCPVTEEIRPNGTNIEGTERVEHRPGCWNSAEGADPTGLAYTRADDEPDDPTPVTGARVEPHVGAMTDEGLVDETPVEHRQVSGSAGGPGENSAECACGIGFDGFDSHAEANRMLGLHIEAATSPTGLTKAADEARGPLAFTTPVVTYFSFDHGQTDPDTGQSLLDHYVTVVAPTYEACREAMFASRFGNQWAFGYLAGTKRATKWIRRWTEHEVIVAPGTDPEGVEKALTAAADLLLVGE